MYAFNILRRAISMEENLSFCKIVLIEDFDKICRCCLSVNPLGSIFEIMYEGTPLDEIVHSLFGTLLNREDDLPEKICETCVGKLICCYIFKKRFEASETALRNIIPIKIVDTDSETKSQCSKSENGVKIEENKHSEEEIQNVQESGTNEKEEGVQKKINRKSETCNKTETVEPKLNVRKKSTRKFPCSCGEIFMSRLEFRQHRELTGHQIPRTHPCKVCGKLFTKYNLWAHSRTHDGIKRYSCSYCTMRFAFSGNLRRHMMQHTGERPHLCEFCGKAFIQQDCLIAHRRVHTGEKPYLCSICGKSFRDKLTCNVHVRNHSGRKPYVNARTKRNPTRTDPTITLICDVCGRSFSRQAAYKIHLNKHGLGEEQVFEGDEQCKICKKFYAGHSLYLHMMTHKDGKRFLCNVCGKGCFTKSALASHVVTHTGEKSLTCEFCGKKFARPQSLRVHRFGHTGEKPYACPSCPKKFRQSSHLTTHLKVHTGERPYICQFCEKSFSQKCNFDIHVRTHTGEKPFQCDSCTNTFHDSGSLKKHKRRKHQ